MASTTAGPEPSPHDPSLDPLADLLAGVAQEGVFNPGGLPFDCYDSAPATFTTEDGFFDRTPFVQLVPSHHSFQRVTIPPGALAAANPAFVRRM